MKIIQEFNSEEYDKLFELEKQCERFLCFKFQDYIKEKSSKKFRIWLIDKNLAINSTLY